MTTETNTQRFLDTQKQITTTDEGRIAFDLIDSRYACMIGGIISKSKAACKGGDYPQTIFRTRDYGKISGVVAYAVSKGYNVTPNEVSGQISAGVESGIFTRDFGIDSSVSAIRENIIRTVDTFVYSNQADKCKDEEE